MGIGENGWVVKMYIKLARVTSFVNALLRTE